MRAFALALALFALVLTAPSRSHAEDGHEPHGAAEHGAAAGHDAHHAPSLHDVNWYYGILLEKEGVEPSLLFRPKGMPVPYLSYLLNAALLWTVIYRVAKKPVRDGLAKRKANIERGMKEAADMKADAQGRLDDYEEKLATVEKEVERVRRDMRSAGELERARVLSEARARRERMERDARLLVEQELAAARENLTRELVHAALRSATEALRARITPQDHARLSDEYLATLSSVKGISRTTRSPA
ncbi:MAG TPA: ATP synthase F0 subunit B [Polyangiaceae bacterium]